MSEAADDEASPGSARATGVPTAAGTGAAIPADAPADASAEAAPDDQRADGAIAAQACDAVLVGAAILPAEPSVVALDGRRADGADPEQACVAVLADASELPFGAEEATKPDSQQADEAVTVQACAAVLAGAAELPFEPEEEAAPDSQRADEAVTAEVCAPASARAAGSSAQPSEEELSASGQADGAVAAKACATIPGRVAKSPAQPPEEGAPDSLRADGAVGTKAASAAAKPRQSILSVSSVGSGCGGRKSYPQFVERLRHASAEVVVQEVRDFLRDFPANLTRPQAARRIHAFLAGATSRLVATEAFADCTAEEAQEVAAEGLEKFVLLKLHKVLFHHSPTDAREDECVEACLRATPLVVPEEIPEDALELLDAAAAELQKVDNYRAPRDKATCLLNAHRICEGIVVEDAFRRGKSRESDHPHGEVSFLHRLLVVLIIKAVPANFASNLEFTACYRQPSRKTDQEERCLRDLARALAAVTGSDGIAPMAASGAGLVRGLWGEALPSWLTDAGISLRFERRSAGDLLLGEVDELLAEYHRMIGVLRALADPGQAAPAPAS